MFSEARIYVDSQFYPYGRDLLLFDDRRGTVLQVTDSSVAWAHLSEPAGCPEGIAGRGALALPLDVLVPKGFVKRFPPVA